MIFIKIQKISLNNHNKKRYIVQYKVILINQLFVFIKSTLAFLNKINVKYDIQKYIAIDIIWYNIHKIEEVVVANDTTKYLV